MFMYLIYVDLPFLDCVMTFVMYALDVYIARPGLRCKQIRLMPWLILYYIDIVNKISSITIVDTSGDIVLKSSNDYVTLES